MLFHYPHSSRIFSMNFFYKNCITKLRIDDGPQNQSQHDYLSMVRDWMPSTNLTYSTQPKCYQRLYSNLAIRQKTFCPNNHNEYIVNAKLFQMLYRYLMEHITFSAIIDGWLLMKSTRHLGQFYAHRTLPVIFTFKSDWHHLSVSEYIKLELNVRHEHTKMCRLFFHATLFTQPTLIIRHNVFLIISRSSLPQSFLGWTIKNFVWRVSFRWRHSIIWRLSTHSLIALFE